MSLTELYKGAKVIEIIENYALSKTPVSRVYEDYVSGSYRFYSDQNFWDSIIAAPSKYWGRKISLNQFIVSDWVARVPGLYWSAAAEVMRRHIMPQDIAIQSREWIEFNPPGKSKKVLGGIGTLLLPPAADGKVLFSVSSGGNASTGIPVLCFPEVMSTLNIKQGDCVTINKAIWYPMDMNWAARFASTRDIPRGYLVIDAIDKINVLKSDCPVVYHPFSIMEYEYESGLFYDFVYLTVDSKRKDVDQEIADFFHYYSRKEGRYGQYLLNPNIVNPLFESVYESPAEFRHKSEMAKLNLLYKRVRDTYFKGESIEHLIIKVSQLYQSASSIKTLARSIGLNVALLADDSAASMSSQLINLCIEREMVESLIDRIAFEYPEII